MGLIGWGEENSEVLGLFPVMGLIVAQHLFCVSARRLFPVMGLIVPELCPKMPDPGLFPVMGLIVRRATPAQGKVGLFPVMGLIVGLQDKSAQNRLSFPRYGVNRYRS